MRFRIRSIQPGDVHECFRLMCERPFYTELYADREKAAIAMRAWRLLLARDAINGILAETPDVPAGQRIVTFGISAFVRKDWLRAYFRDPFPLVGSFIVDRCSATVDEEIILSNREVRHANSGSGLHSIALCYGWSRQIPPEHVFEFRQWSIRCYLEAHKGYRLAEIVNECVSKIEAEAFISSGSWIKRSNYESFYRRQAGDPPPERPVLVGLTKQEAEETGRMGAATAGLFIWREPRYCFSPEQQKLILLAREHPADKDLAVILGITPDALGRRWDRIFKRVEALQPGDDPIFSPDFGPSGKRARLLQRLEKEFHELRPHEFRRPLGQSDSK